MPATEGTTRETGVLLSGSGHSGGGDEQRKIDRKEINRAHGEEIGGFISKSVV